jgi:hypothetical protein
LPSFVLPAIFGKVRYRNKLVPPAWRAFSLRGLGISGQLSSLSGGFKPKQGQNLGQAVDLFQANMTDRVGSLLSFGFRESSLSYSFNVGQLNSLEGCCVLSAILLQNA